MAYETRRGQKYFYRYRRIDGRDVKQYVGKGKAAERAAAEVAQRQRDRQETRRGDQQFANLFLLLGDEFEQYWEASERALRLALRASNYHYRKGEWRRRRESHTAPYSAA